MSDQTNEQPEEGRAEYVARMNSFYDDHLPFLRKQGEFMRLKVEVAEGPLRIEMAKLRLAELKMNQLPRPAETKPSSEERGGTDGPENK